MGGVRRLSHLVVYFLEKVGIKVLRRFIRIPMNKGMRSPDDTAEVEDQEQALANSPQPVTFLWQIPARTEDRPLGWPTAKTWIASGQGAGQLKQLQNTGQGAPGRLEGSG